MIASHPTNKGVAKVQGVGASASAPETALPWGASGDRLVSAAGGMTRGVATGMLAQDARYAAQACNLYPELLAALELVDDMFSMPGRINKTSVRDRVRAALRKAKGEAQ